MIHMESKKMIWWWVCVSVLLLQISLPRWVNVIWTFQLVVYNNLTVNSAVNDVLIWKQVANKWLRVTCAIKSFLISKLVQRIELVGSTHWQGQIGQKLDGLASQFWQMESSLGLWYELGQLRQHLIYTNYCRTT